MFKYEELNKVLHIKHAFFSKNGGCSKGIYKSLNCGLSTKDKKNLVLKNRSIAMEKLGLKKKKLIIPFQTHSNKVKIVDERMINRKISADGLLTVSNKIALGILTADCAPVFLTDVKKKIICAVHAGWKGAKNGIINNSVKLMLEYGSNLNNIISCIGPCIGKDSYLIKNDFFNKFINQNEKNKIFFKKIKNSKFMNFDLKLYIKFKMEEAGIKKVFYNSFDTYKEKRNYFSYRRSKDMNDQDYGRCISIISLI